MAISCDVTGAKSIVGCNVSKSNRKTFKLFHVGLRDVRFFSAILNYDIILRVTKRGIRTVFKHGGIDSYLFHAKNSKLSRKLKIFKKQLLSSMKAKGLAAKSPEEIQFIENVK